MILKRNQALYARKDNPRKTWIAIWRRTAAKHLKTTKSNLICLIEPEILNDRYYTENEIHELIEKAFWKVIDRMNNEAENIIEDIFVLLDKKELLKETDRLIEYILAMDKCPKCGKTSYTKIDNTNYCHYCNP